MDLKSKNRFHLRLLGLIIVGISLSLMNFNCAPPTFSLSDEKTLVLGSNGVIVPLPQTQEPVLDEKVVSGLALLNTRQIYETMTNLVSPESGYDYITFEEYVTRASAYAVTSELTKINSPMMLALASLSSEFCRHAIVGDRYRDDQTRLFIPGIVLDQPVSRVTDEAYANSIKKMFGEFLGREPDADELAMFAAYKTGFMADLTAAEKEQPDYTYWLAISSCSAVLGSYEVLTY